MAILPFISRLVGRTGRDRHTLERPVEDLTALKAIFNETVASALTRDGLELVEGCKWVSTPRNAIRRILELKAGRAVYFPEWGFGVDFVPSVRRSHPRWKRTTKSAHLDIHLDPHMGASRSLDDWSIWYLPSYRMASASEIMQLAEKAALAAHTDFERITTMHDLVALFEERSKIRFPGLQLDNYVQTHITWGLALVAVGRVEEGEAHLLKFCEEMKVDRHHPILLKAHAQASAYSGA